MSTVLIYTGLDILENSGNLSRAGGSVFGGWMLLDQIILMIHSDS